MEELKSLRLVTAIKTPYERNGKIDLDTYDNMVNMQIEKGVQGILVGGTAGEDGVMTLSGLYSLISHIRRSFGNKIKIIGYVGWKLTSDNQISFCNDMDAAMYINPYPHNDNVSSDDRLIVHYDRLLSMGPGIIYRNQHNTSTIGLPMRVVEELSENPNFVGIKENKRGNILTYASKGIHAWTGKDEESHKTIWEYGATGVYSIAGNLVPGLMKELLFEGMNPSLNLKLKPLFDWLFDMSGWSVMNISTLFHNPLNTALAQLGVIKPVFRRPHVPVSVEKRREFVDLVEQIGRDNFVGEKDVRVLDQRDFITYYEEIY
ncbi:4-hydroxy-tetrahydrodipicolinate synthase, chloroplastic-like [Vicia villosa]|uniref:4-hydroxy-tetrahydrodipicolinate synthase, chloroplastic-like n=1 Tax=Vicia villosa TaxID=3911 RepID=UPI00273AFB1B|nr:4-hydroxy-tetrahydrodipicolinate synthase, chloroplastic-like [Vicia villosa]